MGLKSLGENTAQEFFETIIYLTAYEEARSIISNFTKDIDNEILKEAIEDSLNVLAFGLIFYLIRAEENFIEKIFNTASSIVAVLVGSVGRFRQRFKKRGVKGLLSSLFSKYSDENRLKVAEIVVNQTGNLINARNNHYQTQSLLNSYLQNKSNIYQREQLHLNFADTYSKNYIESLMFRLMTSSFTENDRVLLKKILGRDLGSDFDIEALNKVSSFMFVKDDNGNIIGLSQAFIELLNGLGYLHNKGS